MDSENEKFLTQVIVTVFTVIGATCTVLVVSQFPGWGEKKAEWIGALGTIAAFAGTIWIATSERRKRHDAEQNLAMLAAAEVWDRVSNYMYRLEGIAERFGQVGEAKLEVISEIPSTLKSADLWSREEILPLSFARHQVAPRLQRVAVRHERLIRWCDDLMTARNKGFRAHRHQTIRNDLAKSIRDLTQARAELRRLLAQVYEGDDLFH